MCLVVGAVASSCSTHAGLQHWNFGHRDYCASAERSMSWRRLDAADDDQCPSQVGSRQLNISVSNQLATGAWDVQSCSQLIKAAPAWRGQDKAPPRQPSTRLTVMQKKQKNAFYVFIVIIIIMIIALSLLLCHCHNKLLQRHITKLILSGTSA